MPPTVPPAVTPPGGMRPPAQPSPFANQPLATQGTSGAYPYASSQPTPSANPYTTAPSAVPPSEYGPIRDIYDPNFSAAFYGGAVDQALPTQDVPTGRLTGLESRTSRRRRAILSGVATGLAVVLVVGLIAFAVWQTQQGDDGREAARAGAGTPPAAGAAGGEESATDLAAAEDQGDGEVAAGAPGETAQPTDAAGDEPTAESETEDEDEDTAATDDDDGERGDDDGAGAGAATNDEPAGDAGAAAANADDGSEPTPTPSQGGRSLANLVPAEDEVPRGFILTDETEFNEDEVASTFGDPEEAVRRLGGWGWRGHLQRTFEWSADVPAPAGATTFLVVSVHRFDTPESADEALTYFADVVIAAQGLQPVETESIGDEVIVLVGDPDGATLVVLYVRTGPYLVRIGGASPDGNPTEDVVELAKVILVNEPEEQDDTV